LRSGGGFEVTASLPDRPARWGGAGYRGERTVTEGDWGPKRLSGGSNRRIMASRQGPSRPANALGVSLGKAW